MRTAGPIAPAILSLLAAAVIAGCRAATPRVAEERRGAPGQVTPAKAAVPRPSVTSSPAPTETAPAASAASSMNRPPVGRACRVHLRRDAMGLAGAVPLALNR